MTADSEVAAAPPSSDTWTAGTPARIVFDGLMVVAGLVGAYVSTQMGLGTLELPAAGMVPLFASILVTTMFALDIAVALVRPRVPGSGRPPWRVVAILLSIPLYVVAAGYLGHILGTMLVVALLMVSLGSRRWWAIVLTAVLSGVLTCALFTQLLGVFLPAGVFGLGW